MFSSLKPHALVKETVKLWEEKYKDPFILGALDAWSSIWGLTQAIEKAQSLDPAQVVKTWENMKSIETPWGTGTMGGARTYGINHMVLAPAPISRLQNGEVDSTHWYIPVSRKECSSSLCFVRCTNGSRECRRITVAD